MQIQQSHIPIIKKFIHFNPSHQHLNNSTNPSHKIILQQSSQLQSSSTQSLYYKKHWLLIEKSIKLFLLENATINIVALKKSLELLVLNGKTQRLKQDLVRMWKDLFAEVIQRVGREMDNSDISNKGQGQSKKINQQNQSINNNPLISLIQHYKTLQQKLKIIFTLLNSHLSTSPIKPQPCDQYTQQSKLISYPKYNIQSIAYNILCSLILSHPLKSLYLKQMILLIDTYRQSNYSYQNIISQQSCKNQIYIDLLIIKKIGLFKYFQEEFDQCSKDFYVELAGSIQKGKNFLYLINNYLQRQIQLNNIFQPKINTVYYLQKQLIKQYYQLILNQFLQPAIINQQINGLKIFWKFTLSLSVNSNQSIIMNKLIQKIKSIILNTKKYFTLKTNTKQDIFNLINFRQNLINIIQNCFNKNRKILNVVYNTFQELIYQEEKVFLNIAIKNVLVENEEVDIRNNKNKNNSIQLQQQSSTFKKSQLFKLFRISPSKQNFINQFQIRFCKWILKNGFNLKCLKLQQQIIEQMKKQVGNNLMKRLDKMLNDIWRNNQMNYYQNTNRSIAQTYMKCLFLSSNQWPIQLSLVFNISDQLYNLQQQFQTQFKAAIQNSKKQIKWVNQLSTLIISINGIQSIFNAIQASIILLLDKSIRPLRKEQIDASLNVCKINSNVGGKGKDLKTKGTKNQNFNSEDYISQILQKLICHNILTYNQNSSTFDINDENKIPYKGKGLNEQNQQQSNTINIRRSVDIEKDHNVLIQAAIIKILKRRKTMQRSDITRFIEEQIKYFKPTFQQITKAFESLANRQFLQINRNKGIITYIQ